MLILEEKNKTSGFAGGYLFSQMIMELNLCR